MTTKTTSILAGTSGLGGPDLGFVADTGTALPTDEAMTLNTAFKSMGFISEAGLDIATNTATQDVNAYGVFTPVRTLITSEIKTFTITGLETNPVIAAIKARLSIASAPTPGAGTGKWSYTEGAARDALYSFVGHATDGTNIIRKVMPLVRMTALTNEQIARMANISYGFTMTCYPDSNGNSIYTYLAQPSLG